MSHLTLLGPVILMVAVTACQKAKMRAQPAKPMTFATPQRPRPHFQPPPPPPQPFVQPPPPPTQVVVQPPPPAPRPRTPEREGYDIIPVTPAPTPRVDTTPNQPWVSEPPVVRRDPPAQQIVEVQREEPMPAPAPLPAPIRRTERPVPTPPARPAPVAEPAPQGCITSEGMPCPEPKAEAAMCKDPSLKEQKIAVNSPVDVLIVVDTSASLRGGKQKGQAGELEILASEMESFVHQLDPRTDYSIGVVLGHGPQSKNHHGKLYGSVLNYQSFAAKERGTPEQIRKSVAAKIGKQLAAKMRQVPNDSSSAQGEALLYSLYSTVQSLKDKGTRESLQAQKIFRKGAALTVMFVTDEQDVCFDYTGTNHKPRDKKNIERDPKNPKKILREWVGPDRHEENFFRDFCREAGENKQPLTPQLVLTALRGATLQYMGDTHGEKLVLTGIAYTDNSVLPGVEDENEMGHGIVDIVNLADGKIADLAPVYKGNGPISFKPLLESLGRFTSSVMTVRNSLGCRSEHHPEAIDLGSLRMTITAPDGQLLARLSSNCNSAGVCLNDDGSRADGALLPEIKRNEKPPHMPYLSMEIKDIEKLKRTLEQHKIADPRTTKVSISYKTNPLRDPETGAARRR